ncbi:O-acetylhomoserine aminocarboxypropyltransferase/cysteine synthase family protein [Brachybacterium sp. AOP43-C2-M15]|uniref:O-acetylhomoserine aminocarboxypropyltransferase/cysteine synthase family protein n=1 Tax=Brachybacterium sp. AOP43-C2-M15 TaxID=3457661 RepID=UPI00403370E8
MSSPPLHRLRDRDARRPRGFATRQLHAGTLGSTDTPPGSPRATPVHLSAGFVFDDFAQAHARFSGEDESGDVYTRHGNPSARSVERRLAALEAGDGGEAGHAGGTDAAGAEAIFVGSGMAAISGTLTGLLNSGDHLCASSSIYEGTRALLDEHLARFGVTVTFVDRPQDLDAWRAAFTDRTRAAFVETIPNPLNDVSDIAGIAEIAHAHGAPLIVDNTLATPYLCRPLEHGADVVVHSASKFLAGHGTVLGGFIVVGGSFPWDGGRFPQISEALATGSLPSGPGRDSLADYLRGLVIPRLGGVASPLNAFLVEQGLETLSLRMERQSANALRIAGHLASHPLVERVDYSGLPTSPHHRTANRYLGSGYGAVLSVTLTGGLEAARALHDSLEIFTRMTHLGDVRSLVLHPATTTHVQRTAGELAERGVGPGLLRLSIGIEDVEDLLADLEQALASITLAAPTHGVPTHGARADAPAVLAVAGGEGR